MALLVWLGQMDGAASLDIPADPPHAPPQLPNRSIARVCVPEQCRCAAPFEPGSLLDTFGGPG
jgi:hypothetical protein